MRTGIFAVAALGLAVITPATAADLGRRAAAPASPIATSPWEFQASIGPGIYALYNPYGSEPGQHSVFAHGGVAGELTAGYKMSTWITPYAGVRGFVSTAGRGRNLDFSESVPGLGFVTDVTRVASTRMSAFGLVGGVQFGGDTFRVSPYAFVDFVRTSAKFENTFQVPGFAATISQGSAKLSTPVIGAGLKTQIFLTDTWGLSLDAFAGQMTRKYRDEFGAVGSDGRRLAAGGKLAISAKF